VLGDLAVQRVVLAVERRHLADEPDRVRIARHRHVVDVDDRRPEAFGQRLLLDDDRLVDLDPVPAGLVLVVGFR
jgi:hypothetical protein